MATIILDAGTTIQGESTLKTNKIDALAVNHSVELPIAVDKSSGRTRGRSQHGEIELIKAIDKSSANLYFACSKGQNLGDITISLFKNQEDGPAEFFRYNLSQTYVSHITVETFRSEDGVFSDSVVEKVKLNYATVRWTYTIYDGSGQAAGTVSKSWDVQAGTEAV